MTRPIRNLAIMASAGTGKTFRLAMRYLTLTRNIRNIRIIGFDNHIPELHIANHFPTVAIHSSAMSSAAIRMIRNPGEYPCRQLLIAPRIVYG